ncbi:hypothetical protein ASD81_16625 [Nocardioides sp. Root614]|nr:hypothetical protein ASD81_16625 [Nocardioides sp. Root614]KRA87727.1 hypothetical protein ASD84_16895 [Nocardioides sp. Root682]
MLVLDLCHFLAGPYATLALADLGADVVKVEDPEHPDEARNVGPCFREQSVYFESLNWGKRSLAIRLSTEEGRETLLALVGNADVVLDNYKPGVMAKLGLDHDSLSVVNPRIVSCSLSGFGSTGPEAKRPGYDYTIQARTGVMSLTGEPGAAPGKAGISYVDHSGGLAAALAVSAALVERDRTGRGRHVDLGLYDVQMSMLTYIAAWNLNGGYTPARQPSGSHPSIVPAQTFETSDGHVSLFIGNDPMWQRFCGAVDRPGVMDLPAYRTNTGRAENRPVLVSALQALFLESSSQHWVNLLSSAHVPCEEVKSIDDALADPQAAARSLVVSSVDSRGTEFLHTRGPVPLDATIAGRPAPILGADSREVLIDAGLSGELVDDLIARGVVIDGLARV